MAFTAIRWYSSIELESMLNSNFTSYIVVLKDSIHEATAVFTSGTQTRRMQQMMILDPKLHNSFRLSVLIVLVIYAYSHSFSA